MCACVRKRERAREGCGTGCVCLMSLGMAGGTGREKWVKATVQERKAEQAKGEMEAGREG